MSSGLDRFAGRTLGVATMHGKERAIGPALHAVLPIQGFHALPGMDTDQFGSFSGELPRRMDAMEACKAKARRGAEVSGLDLVIASEGSFGPYPPAPFIPCDEEILVLYDARADRFFEHRHVSLETVFGGEECRDWKQVRGFAERMRFPTHGLVVRSREAWAEGDTLIKGISEDGALRAITESLIASNGSCWVETDMRAMMNPTRMRVINDAAKGFAQELTNQCPICGACWFRVTGTVSGLPCMQCGWPTQSMRGVMRGCWHCGHARTAPRPDGKQAEEPLHCANCNP